MRKLLMLAGAAAMTAAMPALADAQGRGKGQSMRSQQNVRVNANQDRVRTDVRTRGNGRVNSTGWVRGDDGRWVRMPSNGAINPNRACPPGLANRTPACVPPGQARRMFREGQRVPTNYRTWTDYDDIPELYRDRFDIPSGYNYIYRDDQVYVVDPATRVVRSIIDLID